MATMRAWQLLRNKNHPCRAARTSARCAKSSKHATLHATEFVVEIACGRDSPGDLPIPCKHSLAARFARSGRPVVLGTFYDQDRSDGPAEFTPHGWGELESIDPNVTDGVGTSYEARTLGSSVAHPLMTGVSVLTANKLAGGNQAKAASIAAAPGAQKNPKGNPAPPAADRISGAPAV